MVWNTTQQIKLNPPNTVLYDFVPIEEIQYLTYRHTGTLVGHHTRRPRQQFGSSRQTEF
jgi:hypothetical protein